MRITWWPAHCLYWAFNAFPSLPQSSLFKILPTSAASQGRPSCLPCDLQLWFFLLHFLPVVFQSNTKISLGQDQAWIYSRDCLCQFCIWVRFPCLALLAPVLTLVAWFLIAPFCSHSECLLSLWHLICDEPNHFWNGGFTFQQRYSWASNHGSYHQSHWAIPFKPGSNSDLKSWYNIKYNKMSLGFPCFYHPCCFVCEVRAPPPLPLFQNQNGRNINKPIKRREGNDQTCVR